MLWFTVFFLPVLPLRVSGAMVCGRCGVNSQLTKAEAQALVARAKSHDQHPAYRPYPV
jgi:hypothetical protein